MGDGMDIQIFLLMVCAVIFFLCIPLVFKLIPPNRLYGFRSSLTLSRPDIWYPANVFSGLCMMVAVAIATAIILFLPELSSGITVPVFISLVFCATVASFAYVKRIA